MLKLFNVFFILLSFALTFIGNVDASGNLHHKNKTLELAQFDDKNEKDLKISIENLRKRLDEQLITVVEEKLHGHVIKLDELLNKIVENKQQHEKAFIVQIIDETRPLYVDAMSDHLLLWAKLRRLSNDPNIKNEVVISEALDAATNQVSALYESFNTETQKLHTYHKERTNLERELERSQGDEALIEYDQKFGDILLLNLEENRDFIITLLAMLEKHKELVLACEMKIKKDDFISIYN
uniref:Secreted protein n=1 Tax=Globodera rostochiensis TaxID=31243 RepID=A0A914H5K1_GLORO